MLLSRIAQFPVSYTHLDVYKRQVEGELGVLAGVEDEVSSDHHTYTDPEEVIDFATRTGCDSLAISILSLIHIYSSPPGNGKFMYTINFCPPGELAYVRFILCCSCLLYTSRCV